MTAAFNIAPPGFGPHLRLVGPESVPAPIGKRILVKATMNDAGEWIYENRELAREDGGWRERAIPGPVLGHDEPKRCATCGRWDCTLHVSTEDRRRG